MKIAITGVLGYSGKYIARELTSRGHEVIGLTNTTNKDNPAEYSIFPLSWNDPDTLAKSMEGVDVLINTYWVRFKHGCFSHELAVNHSKILFDAAKKSGVKKIIHTSITNPDLSSNLSYFRGKALLEEYLKTLNIPHVILRPAVLFGGEAGEDILLNNMAWVLRRFPVIGLFGDGRYKLQPIHVEDFAKLAANEAESNHTNHIINAIGPETFTFRELFSTIAQSINRSCIMIPLPVWMGYAATRLMGLYHRDVMLTWPEIKGLMANTLYVPDAPAGHTSLMKWIQTHSNTLGLQYSSELARRKK